MAQPRFTGQTYGEATAQQERTRAMPTGPAPTDVRMRRPRVAPGDLTPLSAPTARPNEPITAGAPFGPGASPMAAGIPMPRSPLSTALAEVRAIANLEDSDDLYDLLDAYGNEMA
jgi:hypothetical protein